MDRRSGLKKAHFSSVPTRMSLLTCKKYVFLIEKNFPSHPKIGKTQHNAFLWVALETQHNAFLWVALETQHNAFLWVALENSTQRFPMGRVGKLNTTLSYGSRCGVGYGKGRSAEFSRIDPFRFIPNSCF
ncbi:PF11689 family protein [Leptospira interrogans serovar Pyrogenes str. 2006006960]|nr:PF11689 family protein [Leptospira interrogans serovar Pyrogenes str. 2006006960]